MHMQMVETLRRLQPDGRSPRMHAVAHFAFVNYCGAPIIGPQALLRSLDVMGNDLPAHGSKEDANSEHIGGASMQIFSRAGQMSVVSLGLSTKQSKTLFWTSLTRKTRQVLMYTMRASRGNQRNAP